MITYETFLKNFALRPNQPFSATKIVDLRDVTLPRGAVLHYVTDTQANFGIRGSNPIILGEEDRKMRLVFIKEGYGNKGRTKRRVFNTDKSIKAFKLRQRRFTVQRDWAKATASRDMVILDYSPLVMTQTYLDYVERFRDEWENITTPILDLASKVDSDRPQFLTIPMPSTWPSKANFKRVEEKLDTRELKRWVQPGHFWMREIWNALKGNESLLDLEKHKALHLIFSLNGQAMIMSLGDLLARSEDKDNTASMWHKAMTRLFITGTGTDAVDAEGEDDLPEEVPSVLEEPEAPTEERQLVKGVPNTAVLRIADLGQAGKLTAAEQNRLIAIAQNTDNLPAPNGEGTLGEFRKITAQDLEVNEEVKTTVNDKTVPAHAKRSTTLNLTKEYIEKDLLTKDIVNMLSMASNSGVFIQDFKVHPLTDALNQARVFEVKNVPLQGRASTWKIELPIVNPDGSFTADGVRYTMDTQMVDLPIRKTSPQRAALTSYFGKLFIQRAGVVKHDYSKWLRRKISDSALDAEDDRITDQQFGGNDIPRLPLPREYTALMVGLTRFESNGYVFYFDYKGRGLFFGDDVVKAQEKDNRVIVAVSKKKKDGKDSYLTLDDKGYLYKDGQLESKFLEFLGDGWGTPPRDVAEILIFGKRVPIGLVLGYYTGINELIKLTKAKTRKIPSNQRIPKDQKDGDEIFIKFADQYLVVDGTDPTASLIFSGFAASESMLSSFNLSDFNNKDVYTTIFSKIGAARHHLTELEIIKELYIDPITRDILEDMGEPTELVPLMIKAVYLIRNDEWSEETDPRQQRRRGYERISGFVYKKMIEAIREQRNKPNPGNHPVYMGPRDTWAQLVADPTVQLVKDLNPIHFLKEQEAVNLSGEGGRKAQTLVKKSRTFNEKHLGSISESTPDSGKVGIRTYLTANAKTRTMRGLYEEFDFERDGSTSVMSTTALTLPAMNHDDGKRQNLASVQMSAIVPCKGYRTMPYRTGYESVIAARLNEMYAITAQQDGEVTKVTNSILQVKYADGKKKGWRIGRVHGKADGEVIPHDIVTDLSKGYSFKEGEVLGWNEAWFERDLFSKTNVSMKTGAIARTVLLENNDTLEDGSRIGPRLKELLTTTVTKEKAIHVDANQVIENLVSVGDELVYDSVLCTIKNAVIDGIEQTEASLAALAKLSDQNPKSKFDGKVTSIEVFYNANIEDMSDSVKAIVEADNARRKKLKNDLGEEISVTGEIKRASFVGGEKLMPGRVAILINIDAALPQGIGDKAVFGNQLKTIHGGELIGENTTEDGQIFDAFFGYRSVNDRIVNSPVFQGTINTTMRKVTDNFFDILGDD